MNKANSASVLLAYCLAAILCCHDQHVQADDGMTAEQLKQLKDATVFVKSGFRRNSATGSAFLLHRDGNTVYVVSNAHTITLGAEVSEDIRLVFYSGTAREKVVKASVVGRDEARDLSVLKAELENPPKPISVTSPPLRETMTVYIFGFPFGEALGGNVSNPALTIGKGTVSSLRKDEHDNLQAVQIDGDVNPGNSGGPIVDRNGRLIGITVATIVGTQIGIAIPGTHLDEMLQGKIDDVDLHEASRRDDVAVYDANVKLIDPMNKVSSVMVLAIPADHVRSTPKPDRHGQWSYVSRQMQSRQLEVRDGRASGQLEFKAKPDQRTGYIYQIRYVRGDGSICYTEPVTLYVAPPQQQAANLTTPLVTSDEAGGDWIGGGLSSAADTSANLGKPLATGTPLAGEQHRFGGNVFTEVKLDIARSISNIHWANGERSFFSLHRDGVLRKVKVPGLLEEKRIDLGHECHGFVKSSVGLLVVMRGQQEIWVIDEKQLDVKLRIRVPGILAATSSPTMDRAVAVCRGTGRLPHQLAIVDLRQGKVTGFLSPTDLAPGDQADVRRHKTSPGLTHFEIVRATPDGKSMFVSCNASLHRLRLDERGLVHEESGPLGGSNPMRIEISNDSQYVALICGSGNKNVSDHPPIGYYGTYIYKIDNLQKPVLWIKHGANPAALTFNRQARRIFSQGDDHHLISFHIDGDVDQKFALPLDRGDDTRQILAHETGDRLLLLTKKHLFWVVLEN